MTLAERFFSRVDVSAGLKGCWLWDKPTTTGYGGFGKTSAHRWLWTQLFGALPRGIHLDHLCRVRACVNPFHMEPVTHSENIRRGLNGCIAILSGSIVRAREVANAKARAETHCRNGHAYDGTTIVKSTGLVTRFCRECARASWRRWYAKRKQEQQSE